MLLFFFLVFVLFFIIIILYFLASTDGPVTPAAGRHPVRKRHPFFRVLIKPCPPFGRAAARVHVSTQPRGGAGLAGWSSRRHAARLPAAPRHALSRRRLHKINDPAEILSVCKLVTPAARPAPAGIRWLLQHPPLGPASRY